MIKLIIAFVVMYLIISVVLAAKRISAGRAFERATWGVPYGDVEYFYRKPVLFDRWTTIFYPAGSIILLWMRIVQTINEKNG